MVVMMVQILDNFETWWWVESEEGFPRVFPPGDGKSLELFGHLTYIHNSEM